MTSEPASPTPALGLQKADFAAGEIIFREGDPGDTVYLIQDGEAEVIRDIAGQEFRLAVLGKGEIFGEMAVIREQPRSTTLRALGPLTTFVLTKEVFLKAFPKDNPLALQILRSLCGRLSSVNLQLTERRAHGEVARLAETRRIVLLPASSEIESQIGREGIVVESLPFQVGGDMGPGRRPVAGSGELMLRNAGSHHLSTRQFALEDHQGRLVLRDRGSQLGTLVNRIRIARFEETDSIDLNVGENLVQAGGVESPYRFRIMVER